MAYPSHLINEVLRHFYCRWNYGLQPRLSLNTLPDGSIVVSTEVISSMSDVDIPSGSFHVHTVSVKGCRRRSGVNSCARRRIMRSQCQTSSDLLDIPSKQAVQLVPDPDLESEKIEDTGCSGSITVENTTDSEVRPLIECRTIAGGTFNDSEIADEDHERRNSK